MAQVRIDADKIPEIEFRLLARAIIEDAKRYFQDPENMRKYQEWLKSQEQKEEVYINGS